MINKDYLKYDALGSITDVLNKIGSVQLRSFMDEKSFKKIVKEASKIRMKRLYFPLKESYLFAKFNNGGLLKELEAFFSLLVGKRLKVKSSYLISFKHKDYFLLNDIKKESNGFKAIFELTERWDDKSGGYACFLKNGKEFVRIFPIKNSLTIVKTSKDMQSFVKYVNHNAGKRKRIFVEMTLV